VRERLKMDADDRPKISLWVSIERHPLVTNHAYHSLSGYLEIHDWKGHDEDDSSGVFQRTNLSASACG
jgi:hypothetical protein